MKQSIFPSKYLPAAVYLCFADLRQQSARTLAGLFWWLAEPVMQMLAFYFIFTVVFHSGREDFLVFLFVGIVVWQWIQSSIVQASGSVVANSSLIMQVYIPKLIFPIRMTLSSSIKFLFTNLILFAALLIYGITPTVYWLLWPLVVAVGLLFLSSIGFVLSALAPFVPDIGEIMRFGFRILFVVSGVFFDPQRIPERFFFVYEYNPFARLITAFRDILLEARAPDPAVLVALVGLSLAIGALGLHLHNRFDRVFPKLMQGQ